MLSSVAVIGVPPPGVVLGGVTITLPTVTVFSATLSARLTLKLIVVSPVSGPIWSVGTVAVGGVVSAPPPPPPPGPGLGPIGVDAT